MRKDSQHLEGDVLSQLLKNASVWEEPTTANVDYVSLPAINCWCSVRVRVWGRLLG